MATSFTSPMQADDWSPARRDDVSSWRWATGFGVSIDKLEAVITVPVTVHVDIHSARRVGPG